MSFFFLWNRAWGNGTSCESSPVACKTSTCISSSYRVSKKLWDLLIWVQIHLCWALVSCAWAKVSRTCLVLSRLVMLALVPHECMGQPMVGVCSVGRKPSRYLGERGIWFRNILLSLQKTSLGPSWSGLGLISLMVPESALQRKHLCVVPFFLVLSKPFRILLALLEYIEPTWVVYAPK